MKYFEICTINHDILVVFEISEIITTLHRIDFINVLLKTLTFLLSFNLFAQDYCPEGRKYHYKSDIVSFAELWSPSFHCKILQQKEGQSRLTITCEESEESRTVTNLIISQDDIKFNSLLYSDSEDDYLDVQTFEQKILKETIYKSYQERACLTEDEFSQKDHQNLEEKMNFVLIDSEVSQGSEEGSEKGSEEKQKSYFYEFDIHVDENEDKKYSESGSVKLFEINFP